MQYQQTHGYMCRLIWDRTDKQKRGEIVIAEDARRLCPTLTDYQETRLKRDLTRNFLSQYKSKYQASDISRQKKLFKLKYEKTFMTKTYTFLYPVHDPLKQIKKKPGRSRKNVNGPSETPKK